MNIPFNWAISQGYKKIIVVKTRSDDYREPSQSEVSLVITRTMYSEKPALCDNLCHRSERYNLELDELFYLTNHRTVFTLAPSRNIDDVGRLETDMEKLGELYYLGRSDCESRLQELKGYLNYWKEIWPFGIKDNKHPWKKEGIGRWVKADKFVMWFKILVACIPAIIVGVLFDDYLDELFYNYVCVSIMLILFGIAFIVVERVGSRIKSLT